MAVPVVDHDKGEIQSYVVVAGEEELDPKKAFGKRRESDGVVFCQSSTKSTVRHETNISGLINLCEGDGTRLSEEMYTSVLCVLENIWDGEDIGIVTQFYGVANEKVSQGELDVLQVADPLDGLGVRVLNALVEGAEKREMPKNFHVSLAVSAALITKSGDAFDALSDFSEKKPPSPRPEAPRLQKGQFPLQLTNLGSKEDVRVVLAHLRKRVRTFGSKCNVYLTVSAKQTCTIAATKFSYLRVVQIASPPDDLTEIYRTIHAKGKQMRITSSTPPLTRVIASAVFPPDRDLSHTIFFHCCGQKEMMTALNDAAVTMATTVSTAIDDDAQDVHEVVNYFLAERDKLQGTVTKMQTEIGELAHAEKEIARRIYDLEQLTKVGSQSPTALTPTSASGHTYPRTMMLTPSAVDLNFSDETALLTADIVRKEDETFAYLTAAEEQRKELAKAAAAAEKEWIKVSNRCIEIRTAILAAREELSHRGYSRSCALASLEKQWLAELSFVSRPEATSLSHPHSSPTLMESSAMSASRAASRRGSAARHHRSRIVEELSAIHSTMASTDVTNISEIFQKRQQQLADAVAEERRQMGELNSTLMKDRGVAERALSQYTSWLALLFEFVNVTLQVKDQYLRHTGVKNHFSEWLAFDKEPPIPHFLRGAQRKAEIAALDANEELERKSKFSVALIKYSGKRAPLSRPTVENGTSTSEDKTGRGLEPLGKKSSSASLSISTPTKRAATSMDGATKGGLALLDRSPPKEERAKRQQEMVRELSAYRLTRSVLGVGA